MHLCIVSIQSFIPLFLSFVVSTLYLYLHLFVFFQCSVYSSASNTLSIWNADWDPSAYPDAYIYYLEQSKTDSKTIYGLSNVDAFHVFYDKFRRYSSKDDQTENQEFSFSLSLYGDGSIRYRYHLIEDAKLNSDIFRVWGSHSSTSDYESNLWYHQENIDQDEVQAGSDIIFCESRLIACPVSSCIAPGEYFRAYWDGNVDCSALGSNNKRDFVCNWAGGLDTSPASVIFDKDGRQMFVCAVPAMNLLEGSLISMEIISFLSENSSLLPINDNIPGKKAIYQISDLTGLFKNNVSQGELVRHHVMVRYYPDSNSTRVCGCSAVSSPENFPSGSYCDRCSVCRGTPNISNMESSLRMDTLDCNGDCFGSAIIDGCSNCAAGFTGKIPDNSCGMGEIREDTSSSTQSGDLITQLFLVIVIVFCMSCLFSLCMYLARNVLRPVTETDQAIDFIYVQGTPVGVLRREVIPNRNGRGLSDFEKDAIGTTLYKSLPNGNLQNKADSNNSECSICLVYFKDGDYCRKLPEPCGHFFHRDCVDKWFSVSQLCPLCKRSIKKILLGEADDEYENSRSASNSIAFLPQNLMLGSQTRVFTTPVSRDTGTLLEMSALNQSNPNSSRGRPDPRLHIDHV